MKPKISILFDTRKVVTSGEHTGKCHIKILAVFYIEGARVRRYFKTNVFATREEFDKIMSGKFGKGVNDLKEKREQLLELEKKAKDCAIDYIGPDEFENMFYSKGNYKDPLGFMLAYAEELEQEGRIGTRDYYKQAHSSFKDFSKGVMSFATVTPKWLEKYEKHMLDQGKSITTVGMYCIALRTIFNMARSDKRKIIPKDLYPFGKDGYVIPAAKGRKLALSTAHKDILLKYRTLNPDLQKAVDLWKFSYFCSGMNFADIARLKYRHIQDGVLLFDRTKTLKTQRNKESITVVVRPEVQEIITRWGNKSLNPHDFIFPVLREGLTAGQVADRIHDFIAETNEHLETACAEMGIPKITTYWARHTFATILKGKGVSTEFIQEALGHSDIRTTKAYLDSFDLETKKKIANML